MTHYTVYAFTADKARLCAGTTRTDDKVIADFAVAQYAAAGYDTKVETEQ